MRNEMNISKSLMMTAFAVLAGVTFAEADAPIVPVVSSVTMTQAASRLVTITYQLANAPAVVTLDIETNGVSIGGANIDCLSGDVNRIVSENGEHTILWRPDISWPDHIISENICRAAVTAWAPDNPPDYMVVDLSEVNTGDRLAFYPGAEFLPGGVTGNDIYRSSKLVMRKIRAKNVEWTMGEISGVSDNKTHPVKMDSDYYIGVFPVTQTQWKYLCGDVHAEKMAIGLLWAYNAVGEATLRECAVGSATVNAAYQYPNAPHGDSFLGKMRSLVNQRVLFDLPSEAQWEFACRVGHGSGFWGDGTPYGGLTTDDGLGCLGRYSKNRTETDIGGTAQLADVGSYKPNDFGLYDMNGSVLEWCLDVYTDDITANTSGAVNTSGSSPKIHVLRGGCYWKGASDCRPSVRNSDSATSTTQPSYGFRLAAQVGLVLP